jgi:UDP-N-acetylmuramate--alanine ligase
VYNALSALAFSYENKIPFVTIKNSLEGYSGVMRRYEYVGDYKDKKCYCDYAHHPSEIASFINCIKDKDKTLFIFQPHTYSRTKYLMDDFITSLSVAKNLIIYKTYPAREDFDELGDGKTLYKNIKKVNNKVCYAETINGLKEQIKGYNNVNTVCFIGAGDIYDIAVKKIIKK